MAERYAIYYAPSPESELWRLGSAWLGRDAWRRSAAQRPDFPELSLLDLEALTEAPRFYGFHATLRAPFELAPGTKEEALRQSLGALAHRFEPFREPLEVASLGRFLALRPKGEGASLRRLHEAALEIFEPFRAPLGAADLERRRRAGLTEAQEGYLQAWGYPYVREFFRFHMTLSGFLASAVRVEPLLAGLSAYFGSVLSEPVFMEGVALFHQSDRAAPFHMLHWVPFLGR